MYDTCMIWTAYSVINYCNKMLHLNILMFMFLFYVLTELGYSKETLKR